MDTIKAKKKIDQGGLTLTIRSLAQVSGEF